MRRTAAFAILALAALTAAAARTVTVPAASTAVVTLTWTDPSVCVSATPCTFIPYRVPGTVTIAAGATGATALPATAAEATTATDSTVTPGTTYSYAVETVQGAVNSAPSNTVTLTIPAVPAPPVLGSATAVATVTVKSADGTLTATATTKLTVKDVPAIAAKGK